MRGKGTLPAVRVTAKREVYQSVNEEESIFQKVGRSPRANTRNVLKTRVGRTLHAEGMYPYNVQRVQYLESGDLAQRLEFCNWLAGNRRCVFTACLLTYRNSVATVSVIPTTLMCGKMRISRHCGKFLSLTFQCQCVVWRQRRR